MKASFKDGGLMTPTPRTDKLHQAREKANAVMMEWSMGNLDYSAMRWHAESLERETQMLRSEIEMLKSRILKLEPERL